jgi:ATP-binding cassette subfamily C protein LapB
MQLVSRDRTLLLITHKMHLLNLVDRIIVLERGHVVEDGPKEEVLAKLNSGTISGVQNS